MKKINKNLFSPPPSVVKKVTAAMLCVILSGLFLIAGCKKDPVASGGGDPGGGEEPEYPIEIPVTEYSLVEDCQWTNLAYDDKVIVINSEEKLRQYIACTGDSYAAVDFSEYTLLLASGKTNGVVSEVAVKDLQQLSANEYELNIEITLSVFAIVEEWTVALIVEKVDEGSTVNVTTSIVETEFTLRGSTWVLAGFVDVETGEMKEAEPKDLWGLRLCYTFEFNTDSSFLSFSTTNDIIGHYEVDYITNNIRFFDVCTTLVGELGDGNLYYKMLWKIRSFSLKKNELWLYYNDNKNYLLFRSIKGILADTNWKLTGFEDIETGEIRSPEPAGDDLFLLSFNGYYKLSGFTSSNQFTGSYYFYEETSNIFTGASKKTNFDESPDGNQYYYALSKFYYKAESFSLQNDELKLFYNSGKDCLIFKKI